MPHLNASLAALETHLQSVPTLALARQSGWFRRLPRKISPAQWLKAFCAVATCSSAPLRKCAWVLSLICGTSLSKQAVHKRLVRQGHAFLKAVLLFLLARQGSHPAWKAIRPGLGFHRVLLQDSTLLPLPPHLAPFFPGPGNPVGAPCAQLRIQVVMDLLTHRYWHLGFSGFTRNDQRASADLLGLAQPGDLVLRDLGYFVLGILQKFHQQGIWFLSRLRLDLRILDPNTGQDFKLLRRLRRFGSLDASVLLGHDNPLPVRLVALPLPPSVAAERRRRAKANRDRRLNPSKERLALLGWQIFVTNTSATQLKTQDIAHLYGQRWRIETIFKAWKSHFSLGHIRHDASLPQVQALVFARLIFILLVQAIYYPHLQQMAWKLSGSFLSFLKLADLMSTLSAALFTNLLARADPTLLQEALCKHAAYDKRNRPNLLQKLSCLG